MKPILSKWPTRLGAGLVAGAGIVYLDNCAFEGEVSPIIIVALLLAATAMAGAMWGRSAGLQRPPRGRAYPWLTLSSMSSICLTLCTRTRILRSCIWQRSRWWSQRAAPEAVCWSAGSRLAR